MGAGSSESSSTAFLIDWPAVDATERPAGSEPVTLPFIPHDDPRVIDSTGALDLDGIPDKGDACPDAAGPKSDDPKKHGCPPPGDRDKDGYWAKAMVEGAGYTMFNTESIKGSDTSKLEKDPVCDRSKRPFYLPLLPWTGALVGIVPWLALSTLCASFLALFSAAGVALRDLPAAGDGVRRTRPPRARRR